MSKSRAVLGLLIFTLLLGAFFRFYQITEIPIGLYPDEAMNGNNALEALETGIFKIFYPENNGREGLFINLQAISVWLFGNEPWALRVVSAVFGTLTILGVYLLARELFSQNFQLSISNYQSSFGESIFKSLKIVNWQAEIIALLSAFFLATSYWHINFSRIGFRAIMVPFLATFGLYFLLKGLRSGHAWSLVWAGVFAGLGFHTYIAFRFMPFVFAIPLIIYLWYWLKREPNNPPLPLEQAPPLRSGNTPELSNKNRKFGIFGWNSGRLGRVSCSPCAVMLFLFVTFVVALPVGWHFLENPEDFFGRGGQVSIFSTESPLLEFAKSNGLTLQMFFFAGDCNWRHNFNCKPQLNLIVAIFFAIGLIAAIKGFFKSKNQKLQDGFGNYQPIFIFILLLSWLVFMSFPATLTWEGMPHALRSIGMIPPVMIAAGWGAFIVFRKLAYWFETKISEQPGTQIRRIARETTILGALVLLLIPLMTYLDYFSRWAHNPHTYDAFSTSLVHIGQYLNESPDLKKYVVVNMHGVEVRGIPMPAQTPMFISGTFTESKRSQNNVEYVLPEHIGERLNANADERRVVVLLNGFDMNLIRRLSEKYPDFSPFTPRDFVILKQKDF